MGDCPDRATGKKDGDTNKRACKIINNNKQTNNSLLLLLELCDLICSRSLSLLLIQSFRALTENENW